MRRSGRTRLSFHHFELVSTAEMKKKVEEVAVVCRTRTL